MTTQTDVRRAPTVDWLRSAAEVIARIEREQSDPIDRAAKICAEAIAQDALVHVFASGHSRMGLEELFPRIGSFPGFHPVAELSLTSYHAVVGPNGLRQAMFLERVEGFGRVMLEQIKVHPGDAFLIFSSTGINGVVVELALLGRAMGVPVIAITSLAHGRETTSRHSSGERLMDIADVVIDNCTPPGDAATQVPGLEHRVGPLSSIGALSVANALKVRTAELLVERGRPPVVLASPHFSGADAGERQLERVYEEHFRRIGRAYDPDGALAVPTLG